MREVGIAFTGLVTAVGTLLVIDASLPGGFIAGTGSLAYAQTNAFTTLVFFSLFTAFNSRSDTASAFSGLFSNAWLSTVPLDPDDWLLCFAVGSSVLFARESWKLGRRLGIRRG